MLPTLAVRYDRVISRRLDRWLGVHEEQTGFRKGKSTLTQIFTLRIVIKMAKKSNTTIYIGFFDIEKAFDKVSRFLLLKKLIKCGIGSVLLNALKSLYTTTSCVLNLNGKFSSAFSTSSGIRQGAPSSSLLFIIFSNDLIDYIQIRCECEPLIETMHVLLHADDTLILSAERSLFIKKCNFMLDYFEENKLKLNLGKSGYLIIKGKNKDTKESIYLKNGELSYKKQIVYLGLLFSDTGIIKHDIDINIKSRRSNVSVKFSNFCSRNYLAPLKIKLAVLHSCVMSSLCYGTETWGNNSSKELETVYRMGLKTVLSVGFNTCNKIVYIETGTHQIKCMIKRSQIQFWSSLVRNLDVNSSLSKLIQAASNINLSYIMYYENLVTKFVTANKCESDLKSEFSNSIKLKIRNANLYDPDSKLGTYLQVNPDLTTPTHDNNMFEIERVHITRFRTGSHNLHIETGRFTSPRIPRDQRLCVCGNNIQTLHHVLLECNITSMGNIDKFANKFTSVHEFFHWPSLHEYICYIFPRLSRLSYDSSILYY